MLTLESPVARRSEMARAHPVLHHLPQLVMDQIDCGLLVCDAHGFMLHANRAALREVESGQVLKEDDGVVCSSGTASHELSAAMLNAATLGRRKLVCLSESPRLMAVVVPLAAPAGDGRSLVLIMIGRRTLCTPLGLELLAIQHRLTLAEQRVLRELVGGAAARGIASAHGVALSTVRTQIQSIRGKLDVGTIDELLLAAACVPPVPSCH
jgi:DNA-binding CsgD family transcriptional regulator